MITTIYGNGNPQRLIADTLTGSPGTPYYSSERFRDGFELAGMPFITRLGQMTSVHQPGGLPGSHQPFAFEHETVTRWSAAAVANGLVKYVRKSWKEAQMSSP